MNRSEFLFKAVDYLFHPLQNYKKYKGITVIKDIVYDHNYPNECKLNLHYKEGADSYPLLLNIHGGGFVAGDKKHRQSFSNAMAEKGFLVANINYRLAPKHAFPAGTLDAISALKYLEQISKEYKINLNKTILTGDSAGAYYALHAYAALKNNKLGECLEVEPPSFDIAGLLLFCGAYDIEVAIKKKIPFGLTRSIGESFAGIKLDKDFANLQDYKYLDYLSPSAFVQEGWCPCFLVYSKKDFFVGGMAEALIEKLKEYNIPYQEYYSTKFSDNHCFHLLGYTKQAKKCMEAVDTWLEEIKNN